MSDAQMLLQQPTTFTAGDLSLSLAVCDLEVELLVQAEHEAWARNRLEATRGKVGNAVYQADVGRMVEAIAANRFAFGGSLSIDWLSSSVGEVEYVLLLAQKAKTEAKVKQSVSREQLRKAQRGDKAGWVKAMEVLFRRDFPNLMPPEVTPSSGDQGIPAPSTSASSSSSADAPGSGEGGPSST